MKIDFKINTDGSGLWSKQKRKVHCVNLEIYFYVFDGKMHGSLFVEFSKKSWDINKHGLIYTDKNWIKEFKRELKKLGFSFKELKEMGYSEQGRQGDNFVDLDVGEKFIKKFIEIYDERITVGLPTSNV